MDGGSYTVLFYCGGIALVLAVSNLLHDPLDDRCSIRTSRGGCICEDHSRSLLLEPLEPTRAQRALRSALSVEPLYRAHPEQISHRRGASSGLAGL